MEQNTTIKVFRYRLYPNKAQETAMFETLRLTRTLYNAALEQRIAAYRKGVSLSNYDQSAELTALKNECPEFKAVYSHVLQDVLKRLENAYKGFFRRIKRGEKAGFPRFKPAQRWNSFKFQQCWNNLTQAWTTCGKPVADGRRINIPKIGEVKIKLHRPLEGKPKTLEIVLDVDQWYAVYACEVSAVALDPTGSSVGIDVGIAWFAVTSDGEYVANPRHLQKNLSKLRVQQRKVSRRSNKHSNRRRKAVKQVAKTYRKVRRQRSDFHHKTARKLINEHDLIVHEDLKVSNMVRSNLARSIFDVGWSQFFFLLGAKAASAGRRVVAVDPKFTSQTCNKCRHRCKENRLDQARFKCAQCGHEDNADLNAAKNILARVAPSGANDKELSYVVS